MSEVLSSTFRHPITNSRLTRSLFFEMNFQDKDLVRYTLKERAHLGYPSFHEEYIKLNDITEYHVAMTLVDGIEHWEMLCQCDWFQTHLHKMRKELELKLKAQAIAQLQLDAKSVSKTAILSSRFLLTHGYTLASPDKRKPGRPSKAELAAKANEILLSTQDLEEDYNRILKQ